MRLPWIVGALVVGVLIGHALLPAASDEQSVPPAPTTPPVRMALGAYAIDGSFATADTGPDLHLPTRIGTQLIARVPAVILNETTQRLVIRALRVSGPGAALASNDFAMESAPPFPLDPGEVRDLPFALLSDCTVPVRPVPKITIVVEPAAGGAPTDVDVQIPDLDRLRGAPSSAARSHTSTG